MTTASAQPAAAAQGWRLRRWVWPVIQGLATAGVLYWLFADPELLGQMGRTLARADPLWLAAGVALGGVWMAAAAYRWRIFLDVQGIELSYARTAGIYLISMFFTLFLPGAVGGDAVRIIYLFRERPNHKNGVVLSVITDHLSGMVALMCVTMVLTFSRWSWFTQSLITAGTLYFLLGFFLLSLFGLVFTFVGVQTGLVDTLPQRTPGRARLIKFAYAFSLFLRSWRKSLRGVGVAFLVLLGYFLTFYCASRAFGAGASLVDVLSIMPVVDVISGLPLTVSGLGVRESLFVAMLGSLAGVPAEVALLISLTGFFFSTVWSAAGGLVFPLYRFSDGQRRPSVFDEAGELDAPADADAAPAASPMQP